MLSLSADTDLPPPPREMLHLPPGVDGAVWFRESLPLQRVHRHDELEVNVVTKGTATYLLGERRHEMARGAMLWLFPEQDHVLLNPSPDFAMWIAVWTPALVKRVCASERDAPLAQTLAPLETCGRQIGETALARLESLLSEIGAFDATERGGNAAAARSLAREPSSIAGAKDRAAHQARVNAGLAWLLLTTWDAHHAAATRALAGRSIHPAVEQTARLLRDETYPLPLPEIARRVGLSASRLGRLFHAQTGQTIPAFRNRQRIERYLRLRRSHSAGARPTCLEAALAAGFGSYAQFHRVFKESEHCRPGEQGE